MGNKRELTQGGGRFDQPLDFYVMAEAADSDNSVARTPTFAYRMMGAVNPYLGMETRSALREIGETWATIEIRYFPSRIPVEGMTLTIAATGENYEIRGVNHVAMSRKKIELTCRKVR